MYKLERSCTFARRNEVMLEVLYLLKTNSAFPGRVLKMKATAIFHTIEDIEVARLYVFVSLVILFLI